MGRDQENSTHGEVASWDDRGTHDRWFVLSFLALDYFVLYLHRNVINYVQPPLEADLHLTQTDVGDLQMAFILAYSFSQLFVGYLGDRFNRRTVLLCSLTGSVLVLASMGLVSSFSQLVVLWVILGVAQSASVPAIGSMVGDCFTAKTRSTAVGIYLVSQNVALIVAGGLGGEIADIPTWTLPKIFGLGPFEVAGWRMSMLVFGVVGAVVGLVIFLFLREPKRRERQEGQGLGVAGASFWQTAWAVVRVHSYLVLAAVFVLFCMTNNALQLWLARYFHGALHMDLGEAGRFATIYVQSSNIVGLLVGGRWADYCAKRWQTGRQSVQLVGMALLLPALLALGTVSSKVGLIFAMVALGFGTGLYSANLWTSAFEVVDPAARAMAIGFFNVVAMLASPTARIIGQGVDEDLFGLNDAFAGLSLLPAIAVLLLVLNMVVFLRHDYRGPLK